MATTTGIIRCCGAKASATSPSPDLDCIWGRGLSAGVGGGAAPRQPRPQAGAQPPAQHRQPHRPRQAAAEATIPSGRGARGNYLSFRAEQAGVGNKTIGLKNCRNVILRDFSLLKGGHFGMLVTGVDNLTIDNLKIDTDRDGMDIDCCRNVRVSNCTVNSPWDDAIVPKSSFALGYNRACENIAITNCYVSGCWELGSVLDGTWKRQAQRRHWTNQVRHRIQRRLQEHGHLQLHI